MKSTKRAILYLIVSCLPIVANSTAPKCLLAQTRSQGCIEPLRRDESFDLSKAVRKSKYIIIGRYKGLKDKNRSISYFNPPTAVYECLHTLKGEVPLRKTSIRYEFHNRDNSDKPKGWKFDYSLLPPKDSKWILLIDDKLDETYETVGGKQGRIEFSVANQSKVTELLRQ